MTAAREWEEVIKKINQVREELMLLRAKMRQVRLSLKDIIIRGEEEV